MRDINDICLAGDDSCLADDDIYPENDGMSY